MLAPQSAIPESPQLHMRGEYAEREAARRSSGIDIAECAIRRRRIRRLLLGAVGAVCVAAVAAAERPPSAPKAWTSPLPVPLGVTGTPGEYRAGHLHAGVDLSTGGHTGMPVRAVRSGTVVRVRASGSGYGRALHLRFDDGSELLYGHLERFAPALEAYVREAQQRAGEYEVDLYPEPGRFVFDAGNTIGWSGESGAGPPHVHLEARVGDTVLNALTLGLRAPDVRAPVLGPVGLRALGAEAFVAESTQATTENPGAPLRVWGRVGIECRVVDASGTTTARLAPLRIRVTLDSASVFVRHFDRFPIDTGPTVQRVYGSLFDADGPWSYRLYRWPPGAGPDATEEVLQDGVIDFAALPLGKHRIGIEACDANGGCGDITLDVVVQPPPRIAELRTAPDRSGGWLIGLRLSQPVDSLCLPLCLQTEEAAPVRAKSTVAARPEWRERDECLELGDGWFCARCPGDGPVRLVDRSGRVVLPPIRPAAGKTPAQAWGASRVVTRIEEGMLLIEVHPPELFPGLPRGRLILDSGASVPLALRGPCGDRGWAFGVEHGAFEGGVRQLAIDFSGRADTVEIQMASLIGLRPGGTGEPVHCLGGRLTLVPAVGSLFGGMVVEVQVAPAADSLPLPEADRLTAVSPVVLLAPSRWPLAAPMGLRFPDSTLAGLDASDPTWGLYREVREGRWRWVGRTADVEGLGADVTEFGTFAILADRVAPAVSGARPEDGAVLGEPPAMLRVRLGDVGSGFDPRNADIDFDGRPLLAVWDIDEGTLTARPEGVARGAHTWDVRVTDRAGNRAVVHQRFEVTGR
jgi:murein DD-endopeptidase MepM/ murein hydrolase activator NlpD